jgi:hypothetical protein
MGDSEANINGLLTRLLDAFNRHDLDAIMELFAEDAILDMPRGPHPWGQRFVGKAQVREALAGRFKGLPDVHYGEGRHFVSGNMGSLTLCGSPGDQSRIGVTTSRDLFRVRVPPGQAGRDRPAPRGRAYRPRARSDRR